MAVPRNLPAIVWKGDFKQSIPMMLDLSGMASDCFLAIENYNRVKDVEIRTACSKVNALL